MEEFPGSLVAAGQVIKYLSVDGCRHTDLLGAVTPVLDTVTGTESLERTDMINVYFTGVSCVGLCKSVHVRSARAQKVVPEEKIGRKFRVVPSVSSNIIAPGVSVYVVCVYDNVLVILFLKSLEIRVGSISIKESGPSKHIKKE